MPPAPEPTSVPVEGLGGSLEGSSVSGDSVKSPVGPKSRAVEGLGEWEGSSVDGDSQSGQKSPVARPVEGLEGSSISGESSTPATPHTTQHSAP